MAFAAPAASDPPMRVTITSQANSAGSMPSTVFHASTIAGIVVTSSSSMMRRLRQRDVGGDAVAERGGGAASGPAPTGCPVGPTAVDRRTRRARHTSRRGRRSRAAPRSPHQAPGGATPPRAPASSSLGGADDDLDREQGRGGADQAQHRARHRAPRAWRWAGEPARRRTCRRQVRRPRWRATMRCAKCGHLEYGHRGVAGEGRHELAAEQRGQSG